MCNVLNKYQTLSLQHTNIFTQDTLHPSLILKKAGAVHMEK